MAKKVLRTYFLNVLHKDESNLLTKKEIESLFHTISLIPLGKNKNNSRVSEIQKGIYYMVLSSDDDNIPAFDNCIKRNAIFRTMGQYFDEFKNNTK